MGPDGTGNEEVRSSGVGPDGRRSMVVAAKVEGSVVGIKGCGWLMDSILRSGSFHSVGHCG